MSVLMVAAALTMSGMAGRAQSVERSITQFPIETWESAEGLPGNTVESITQTRDGYLWIGTEDGIARFDGVRFTDMTRLNAPGIIAKFIPVMVPDGLSGLWAGSAGGGLFRYSGSAFGVIKASHGLSSNAIYALLPARGGGVWVGSAAGLDLWKGGRVVKASAPGLKGSFVRALAEGPGGAIWAGTEKRGLLLISGDSATIPPGTARLASESIRALQYDSDGVLWIGTAHGLYRYENEVLRPAVTGSSDLTKTEIRALLLGRSGALWIGTAGEGLKRLHRGKLETLTSADGLPNDIVSALYEDAEGNMWVGTQGAGLAVLRQGVFLGLTPREGLSGAIVLPIMEDRSGTLWVGTFGAGLNRIRNGRISVFTENNGLSSNFVLSLAEDRDSSLWIGTRRGLDRLKNGVIAKFHAGRNEITTAVTAILPVEDGTVWVGTSAGLSKIRGNTIETFTTANGLSSSFIYSILKSRTGDLWIGTNGGGLNKRWNSKFEHYSAADGLGSDVIYTVHEDKQGTLWIATTGGLTRLKGGKFVNLGVEQGLLDDKIFRILEDAAGNFWMSSNRGIFRIAQEELNAVADGRLRQASSTYFTEKNGMPSREANGAFQPAGWADKSGRLWFPTMKGATSVDPSRIGIGPAVFPVVVERVLANASEVKGEELKNLRSDARHIQFDYTALSFVSSNSIVFEYTLEGYDEGWISAGTRRSAFYTNIPPGHYTFRVRARNQTSGWSVSHASLPLSINPFFYQTNVFRVLSALGLVGLLLGLDRFRTISHRRRERMLMETAEERQRAEKRYRGIFEGANDLIFTTDVAGRLLSANRASRQLLGIHGELPGEVRLADVVFPESLSVFQTSSGGVPGVQQNSKPQEVRLRSADGTQIPVEVSIQEIRENGELTGLQAIARDITERRMLESRLRQSQRMEAVGQLAGGIAHDFNNILSVIKSTAFFLSDTLRGDQRVAEDINEINKAADRGAALTQQLLAFTRKQVMRSEIINLNDLVRDAEGMLRRTVRENIEIVTHYHSGLFNVEADPGQIHQVLLNLVVNARDAMPHGGSISIRLRNLVINKGDIQMRSHPMRPGRYACVTVTDTGSGIDPENIERVFEPFFTTKELGRGTGLGLATVYGIVKQSGGYVWLSSEIGAGTAADVCLPASDSVSSQKSAASGRNVAGASGETILIVEDDPAIRRLMERIVRQAGYKTLLAANGKEGIEIVRNCPSKVDLVVTDVVMPVMGGKEMADILMRSDPHIKVIFTSGYAEEEITEIRAGSDSVAFLNKPVAAEDVRAKISEMLANRSIDGLPDIAN